MYRLGFVPLALLSSLVCVRPASAQIHHLAQMTTEQIQALDRERTVVLLPGGILEQHGPYLPSYADGYMNEWTTARLAEAIVARPGWSVLIFPVIPLGSGGANEIGRQYVFPGTYAVRAATLRAVFMDLATELGEQGFRWVFIVHLHGAPNHNRMLDQAGDYFRDIYGGQMVHLMGLVPVITAGSGDELGEAPGETERTEDGFSPHAGANETSRLLFLHPELVRERYREAPPETGQDWEDLVELAREPDWPGYFGSPRLASASRGARAMEAKAEVASQLALQILDGADVGAIPRIGAVMRESPVNVLIDQDALRRDEAVRSQQEEWLESQGYK